MPENPSYRRVLVVARQAGSANAFTPVLRELARKEHKVQAFGLAQAQDAWRRDGVPFIHVRSFAEASLHLAAMSPPDVLLSGTSEVAEDDARFWRWAEDLKIPAIAWIDTWGDGHHHRFTSKNGNAFDLRPRLIGVIDERARAELLSVGCGPAGILLMGHPGFDAIASLPPVCPQPAKGQARTVLFVSEPLHQVDETNRPSYTEEAVIADVTDCLAAICEGSKETLRLLIKPHPREDGERLRSLVAHLPNYPSLHVEVTDGDRLLLPRLADAVVGMTSILLVECLSMGRRVVAYQPGRQRGCPVTDDREGLDVVTQRDLLLPALQQALAAGALSNTATVPTGGVVNFLRVLERARWVETQK